MREYLIKRKTDKMWDAAERADIDNFQWVTDYTPKSHAWLLYDDENIYVKMESYDSEVFAECKERNGEVSEDSCLEFFICPVSKPNYINIEINIIGTLYLGTATGRPDITPLDDPEEIFDIKTSVKDIKDYNGEKWTVEYKVPFSFLKKVYGEFDIKDGFYANMYKICMAKEHYGTWNPIDYPTPEFHWKKSFGKLNLE